MSIENNSVVVLKLNRLINYLLILWIFVISFSFIWDITFVKDVVMYAAKSVAITEFKRDLGLRQWVSMHGGVYVPETVKTPSNPYLKIDNKDIILPSGKSFTLMNPAYVMKQLQEFLKEEDNVVKGHITSLNPLNPQNYPDEWEIKSLNLFEEGVQEVSEVIKEGGKQYYRIMRPFVVGENCLKCHESQGYKLGEIRGGISQYVDLSPFLAYSNHHKITSLFIHLLSILFGFLTVKIGGSYFIKRIQVSIDTEKNLLLTQSQLSYKDELLQIYMDKSPLIYVELDKDYNIIAWNKRAENVFQYSKDEIIGKNMEIIIPDFEKDRLAIVASKLFENDSEGFFSTNQNITKNGDLIYCEWSNTPILGDDQQVSKVICMGEDITQEKEYENRLVEQNSLFDALINSSKDLIYLKDTAGKYLIVNSAFSSFIKLDKEYVLGKTMFELVKDNRIDTFDHDEKTVIQTRQSITTVGDFETVDGSVETLEIIKSPVVNNTSGDLIGVLGIARNQTEMTKIQRELTVSSEEKEKVLSTISCGVTRLDNAGNIIYMNDRGVQLLGYDNDHIVGENHHNLIHISKEQCADHEVMDCPVKQTYEKGILVSIDRDIFWHKDGSPIDVSYKSSPIYEGENIIGAVLTFLDIRQKLANENEILKTLKEKETLIQEIHHRVKNNMQVIYSLLSLQADQYSDIPELSNALTESQNRILSMSAVHQMLYQTADMTNINLEEYIDNLLELISYNYGLPGIQYEIEGNDILLGIDKAVPVGLMLNEVISNALKHSGDKTNLIIKFQLFTEEEKYSIFISDNGSGFPDGFSIEKSETLGCQLLMGLADQIGGSLSIGNNPGAYYNIDIPLNKNMRHNHS